MRCHSRKVTFSASSIPKLPITPFCGNLYFGKTGHLACSPSELFQSLQSEVEEHHPIKEHRDKDGDEGQHKRMLAWEEIPQK
jgi:hypothetical protein